MPRRIYHMPGQSMYAGAWDVLMLTFEVGCSTGLALKPPGGPSAVAAVAIVAVPAARDWVQARRVVGVRAVADATMRKRPRIVGRSGVPHGSGRLCLVIGCSLRVALWVTRCTEVPAMQQRPKIRVGLLAAEDGCNPMLSAWLPLPDSSPTQARVATRSSDHLEL